MTGWTYTLACTRAEAEAVPAADPFDDLATPPTLMVDEPDPARPEDWVLIAFFDAEPEAALLSRIDALAPSARGGGQLAPLADADWMVLSQRGLEPVRAGRFLIHTPAHAGALRPGDRGIEIEAGLAFGTGQHATTQGCLAAIDRLARQRRFANIVDLGTGTGVLAIAALKAWPGCRGGGERHRSCRDYGDARQSGGQPGAAGAAGWRDRGFRRCGDAAPAACRTRSPRSRYRQYSRRTALVAMSRDVARTVARGGMLILAGLLDVQARRVRAAYRRHGLVPLRQHSPGEWPVLVLARPFRHARHGTAGSR